MAVWGAALFSDDEALDVRDHYRELLEDGVEDSAASRQTLEKFEEYLKEPDSIAGGPWADSAEDVQLRRKLTICRDCK